MIRDCPTPGYCELNPCTGRCKTAVDSHDMVTFHNLRPDEPAASFLPPRAKIDTTKIADLPVAGAKPTNPKDSFGIRKVPMSVVPCGVLAEIGVGMYEGTGKYGRHNYRAMGVQASVYYDATMRHIMSWWEGEDIDPDSGLSHVTKAICSLVVLRDAMMQGMVTDDRPPRSEPFYERLNAAAAAIVDKHADKKPHHYTQADPVAVKIGVPA